MLFYQGNGGVTGARARGKSWMTGIVRERGGATSRRVSEHASLVLYRKPCHGG